jgi:hypothetical protein
MGSPQGRHIEIQYQDFYLNIETEGDGGLQFTNSSLMPTLEFLEIATYKLLLRSPAKTQTPNPPLPKPPSRNHRSQHIPAHARDAAAQRNQFLSLPHLVLISGKAYRVIYTDRKYH